MDESSKGRLLLIIRDSSYRALMPDDSPRANVTVGVAGGVETDIT